MWLTLLLFRALAKYCVPISVILFPSRFRVVSIYVEWKWQIVDHWWPRDVIYCIILQCISQITYSFIANLILVQFQRRECLWSMMMMMYEINKEVNSLHDFPMQRPNSLHLHRRFGWHKDLVLPVPRLHYKYAIDEQRINTDFDIIQCLRQILDTCNADSISSEIKCGDCLCGITIVKKSRHAQHETYCVRY